MDETFRALFALLSLLFAVTACGGGGEEPAHPPSISNLRYAPATALQAPDGTATINGSFDFIDAGSDIASLRITSSGGVDLSLPTPALAAIRSGTGTGTFVVSVDRIDKYTFELWLIDSRGSAVGRDALRGGGSVDLPLALRCSGLTHGSTVGERRFRSLRAMRAPWTPPSLAGATPVPRKGEQRRISGAPKNTPAVSAARFTAAGARRPSSPVRRESHGAGRPLSRLSLMPQGSSIDHSRKLEAALGGGIS